MTQSSESTSTEFEFESFDKKTFNELKDQIEENKKKIDPEQFKGLSKSEKRWVYLSIVVSALGGWFSSRLELEFGTVLAGVRLVKHFVFHGTKISIDVLKNCYKAIMNLDGTSKIFESTVNVTKHTIGSSLTTGGVFLIIGLIESILKIFRYIYNSWWKRNNIYCFDALLKDLKHIFWSNLIAAGVTSSVCAILVSILMAASVTVAYPYILAAMASSIVGSIAKWAYNKRNDWGLYSKTNRNETYRKFAKSDNKKNRASQSGKEEWPEELDDLVWIIESMSCLSFVIKGTLDDEKINHMYKEKSGDTQFLKGFDKLQKQGKWVFRRAILGRYVQEIQKTGSDVETVIVKACQVRQSNKQGGCLIM